MKCRKQPNDSKDKLKYLSKYTPQIKQTLSIKNQSKKLMN